MEKPVLEQEQEKNSIFEKGVDPVLLQQMVEEKFNANLASYQAISRKDRKAKRNRIIYSFIFGIIIFIGVAFLIVKFAEADQNMLSGTIDNIAFYDEDIYKLNEGNAKEIFKINYEQSQQILMLYMNRQETFFKLISILVTVFLFMLGLIGFKSIQELKKSIIESYQNEMERKMLVFSEEYKSKFDSIFEKNAKNTEDISTIYKSIERIEKSISIWDSKFEEYAIDIKNVKNKIFIASDRLDELLEVELLFAEYYKRINCEKTTAKGKEVYFYKIDKLASVNDEEPEVDMSNTYKLLGEIGAKQLKERLMTSRHKNI